MWPLTITLLVWGLVSTKMSSLFITRLLICHGKTCKDVALIDSTMYQVETYIMTGNQCNDQKAHHLLW
jgi:hypothetical protein